MSGKTFYVYEIIDPRNNKIFYIGKGSGKRMYYHMQRALQHKHYNRKLQNKLLKIVACGLQPIYRKTICNSEHDAYIYEQQLIANFGLNILCNLAEGGNGNKNPSKSTRNKIAIAVTKAWKKGKFDHSNVNSHYGNLISEDVICPHCGNSFHREYREKRQSKNIPKFCSRSCANSRHWNNETNKQRSEKLKGIKTGRNISGSKNPMYGKHHSEETKLKISQNKKNKCLSLIKVI